MTKINDYLWHLPHEPLVGDPPDVRLFQECFNGPIVAALEEPLLALGYQLKSNDVLVRLDDRVDNTADTYYANVRFIRYLRPDVMARAHFEHFEWAHFLPSSQEHRYVINLDRFKISDPTTQMVVPQWEGRLHTRMSNRVEYVLEHSGPDQVWTFRSGGELQRQLELFFDKFKEVGIPWLEDPRTMGAD